MFTKKRGILSRDEEDESKNPRRIRCDTLRVFRRNLTKSQAKRAVSTEHTFALLSNTPYFCESHHGRPEELCPLPDTISKRPLRCNFSISASLGLGLNTNFYASAAALAVAPNL